MYGFLLCFVLIFVGIILYYVFDMLVLYLLWLLLKLFGILGGILMVLGMVEFVCLKLKVDKDLGVLFVWGGEMGFIFLLFFVVLSGLLFYVLGSMVVMLVFLVLYFGLVFSFFLLMFYIKMVYGFYCFVVLVCDE